MARKKRNSKSPSPSSGGGKKNKQKNQEEEAAVAMKEESLLEAIEGMSSSDEDERRAGVPQKTNAKAEALKAQLKSGLFNQLISKDKKKSKVEEDEDDDDDDSIEEVVLGDDDDEDDESATENDGKVVTKNDGQPDEDDEEEEEDEGKGSDQSDNDEDNDDKEEENPELEGVFDRNSKALSAKTEQLQAEKKSFPWVERFDVVSSVPLPFGNTDEATGQKIDVHDDLSREVAFYNVAMEAVENARGLCKKNGVPFARPEDFFAEMIKSDDHMARVKDRLIFENKKIEAVAQRKSNKEQKLRSKEAHSNKLAEKAKRRKDNINFVDDWAKTAASNRGGKYGDNDDKKYLQKMGSADKGPNRKRQAADKKYGFGGKRGRFKQNDPKSMNDLSGFNPKGNFNGAGTKRQGKRARDAGRKRQRSS